MIKTADLTPRQKKTAIALASILAAYLLFGFLGAPFIVRSVLEKQVAGAINRQVTVGPVRVNPITLSVTLRDLDVREADGTPFVRLDEAYANLQMSSLFKWALVLKSVRVLNPDISLIRSGETTFNFSDIPKNNPPEPPGAETPDGGGGFAMAIYDARITGGRVAMDDRVVTVSHRIEDLNLNLTDLSSRPADADVTTLFGLTARINGAAFSLEGKTRPFGPARETEADLGLKSVQTLHYLPYVPLPENLTVRSLHLDTETELAFRMLEDGQPELVVAGTLSLSDVKLADGKGDPFVNHPNLEFDLLPSRVLSGQVRLARVESSGPEYFLERLPSGELYLPFLAAKAYDEVEKKTAGDATDAFQPVVTIDMLSLKEAVVHFNDLSNQDPFATTITDLGLEVNNFGLNSDRTAAYHLSLKTEADESVTVSGSASLAPLQASGDGRRVRRRRLAIRPLLQGQFSTSRPWMARFSFGGSYRFRQETDTPLVSLSGVHLDVDRLKVVDEDDDEPLVSIDQLRMADTTAELSRGELTLGSLVLSGAALSCRREKDGSLNLIQAFAPSAPAAEPETDVLAVADGDSGARRPNRRPLSSISRPSNSRISL